MQAMNPNAPAAFINHQVSFQHWVDADNVLGAYYLQSRGRLSVTQSKLPVRASQDHKGKEQAEEDGYKDNVRPQRAD